MRLKKKRKHLTKKRRKKQCSYLEPFQRTLQKCQLKSSAYTKIQLKKRPAALNDGECKYSSRVLFLAVEMGTLIGEVIRQYPHLVWEANDDNQSIFHVAVSYGHVGVYKLLNELGSSNKHLKIALEDKDGKLATICRI